MLEDYESRSIRYLRLYYDEKGHKSGKRYLKLVQLGVMVNQSHLAPSPLLKFRSVAKFNPETGKYSQISLVVRQNGRFEVYSDFMLVSSHYDPQYQCVDVETDFSQYYLKFV